MQIRRRRLLAALAFLGMAPAARAQTPTDQTCTGGAGAGEDQFGAAPGAQVVLARQGGKLVPQSATYATAGVKPTLTEAGRTYKLLNAGSTGKLPGSVSLVVIYAMGLDAAGKITSNMSGARIIMPGLQKTGDPALLNVTVTVSTGGKSLSIPPELLPLNNAYAFNIAGSPLTTPRTGYIGVDTVAGPAFGTAFGGGAPLLVVVAKDGKELYRASVQAPDQTTQNVLIQQALDDSARRMSAPYDAQCQSAGAGSSGYSGSGGYDDYDDCFLTTAACGQVGLADDCWELRTLRAFRDGPLQALPGGPAVSADYYDRAPRIVAGIGARADAGRVWLATYWTGIVPCALAAKAGAHGVALAMYRRMTLRLERLAA